MSERHKEYPVRHQRPRAADRADRPASSGDLQRQFDQDHDRQHLQGRLRGQEGHCFHIQQPVATPDWQSLPNRGPYCVQAGHSVPINFRVNKFSPANKHKNKHNNNHKKY